MAYYFNKEKKYYEVSFYVKVNGKRKQVHRRGFATVKAAKEFEREYLNKYNNSTEMTFQSLYELYIEYYIKRIKSTTMRTKKNIFKNSLLPFFKDMRTNEITPIIIADWQNEMLGKNFKVSYLRTCNAQLRGIFNYADKFFNIPNPTKKSDPICKNVKKELNVWGIEEFNKFIESVDKKLYKIAFLVLFWTGIRSGELFALTLGDLDFKNNYINIDKNFWRGEILTTKTESSNRRIKITDDLKNVLIDLTNSLPNLQKDDRIFIMSEDRLNTILRKKSKELGLNKVTAHDLRHSHASILISNNFSIVAVSKRLGHKNTSMTLNTYSHLLKDDELNLIKKMENLK